MKNFIFDFYNTLVSIHTEEHDPESWRGAVGFLAERGIKSDPETLIKLYDERWAEHISDLEQTSKYAYPEGDIKKVYKSMVTALGGTLSDSAAAACAVLARRQSIRRLELFGGTVELLNALKARGCKLYILSNAQSVFTVGELEQSGVVDMFDGVLLSSDYGCRKPDPAFFDFLFKKFKLKKPESVMIGDDPNSDGKGAQNYGIAYVMADGGAAAHSRQILALTEKD
ncbi:MAG: HAD family hydrolase [Clostridiales bacterium]|nr:HAD family hydrolase [Clostridiales bacterium]